MNNKPPSYTEKRKRKPGEMNVDRRERWFRRVLVRVFGARALPPNDPRRQRS